MNSSARGRMTRSARPLIVSVVGLAVLAGCGSSTSATSASTSTSTATTPAVMTPTTTTSGAPSTTTASTASTSDTGTSSSAAATSTGTASTSTSPASGSGSASGVPSGSAGSATTHTVGAWRVSVPAGWTGSSTANSDGYVDDWKPSSTSTLQVALVSGRPDPGETFADDTKAALQNFSEGGSVEVNTPVTVKGATQAREIAGYSVDADTGKKRYVDLVLALKDHDTALLMAMADTRSALQAAHLHPYLLTLTHV